MSNNRLHLIFSLFLLLLLLACARIRPVEVRESDANRVEAPAGCWLQQPTTYRMRHSAELEYQNQRKNFEGFIEVSPKPDCRAHLVIFTALGVTLLDLEIREHSFSFTNTGQSAPGRREYRFAAAAADAVQKIFFALAGSRGPDPELRLCLSNPATSPAGPADLAEINTSGWQVRYLDYRQYPCGRLPQRIILKNHRPQFRLTLWLLKAAGGKRGCDDS